MSRDEVFLEAANNIAVIIVQTAARPLRGRVNAVIQTAGNDQMLGWRDFSRRPVCIRLAGFILCTQFPLLTFEKTSRAFRNYDEMTGAWSADSELLLA